LKICGHCAATSERGKPYCAEPMRSPSTKRSIACTALPSESAPALENHRPLQVIGRGRLIDEAEERGGVLVFLTLEEDRDSVAVRYLGERSLLIADADLDHVIAGADAEGEQRADVER